jgi:hypothetical protein
VAGRALERCARLVGHPGQPNDLGAERRAGAGVAGERGREIVRGVAGAAEAGVDRPGEIAQHGHQLAHGGGEGSLRANRCFGRLRQCGDRLLCAPVRQRQQQADQRRAIGVAVVHAQNQRGTAGAAVDQCEFP